MRNALLMGSALMAIFAFAGCMPSEKWSSPFYEAAMKGDIATVARYLDSGTSADQPDDHNWTALQYATASAAPQMSIVRLLLDRGADVNTRHSTGSTPLYLAAIRGHVGVARFLIERGADVELARDQLESVTNENHERGLRTLERATRPRPPAGLQGTSDGSMDAILKAAQDARAKKASAASGDEEELRLRLVFDKGVPEEWRQPIRTSASTSLTLLGKYNMPLALQVTVRVTPSPAAYIEALSATHSKEEAQRIGGHSYGISIDKLDLILIRGVPELATDPAKAYMVLAHELFHQVQNQYGKSYPAAWLVEGSADLFSLLAMEQAGVAKVEDHLRVATERLTRAKSIPDVHQLAGKDPHQFQALNEKNEPVYPMSLVMVSRLVGGKDFTKVAQFYRLLNGGKDMDSAFHQAFGTTMNAFLDESNKYFDSLRAKS